MPISTRWYDAQHSIILHEVIDPWTWDDYLSADLDVQKMRFGHVGTTARVFDFRRSRDVPLGALSYLSHFARQIHNQPSDRDVVILVDASHRLRLMLDVVLRLFPQAASQIYYVETRHQANLVVYHARRRELVSQLSSRL